LKEIRLAVIGGGKMGEAIIKGLLAAGTLHSNDIVVSDIDPSRRRHLAQEYDVSATESNSAAATGAQVVLLAVKPQQIDVTLAELSSALRSRPLVISIAAGVSIARIAAHLPDATPIVRAMPNTAAQVGKAITAISPGPFVEDSSLELAERLLSSIGSVVVIDERLQNSAVAINGSGPAYFYLFIEALVDSGVANGLDRDVATRLAVETMAGAAEMLARTGKHPALLIDEVASPGGTTIAALEAFEAAGLRTAVFNAVDAAVRRANELG